MGSIKWVSSSSNDCDYNTKIISVKGPVRFTPSPEIENYTIVKWFYYNEHLMVWVNYKDVDNYEGNKIMIYKNCTIEQLTSQKLIDPHFSSNKEMYSPFVRLEPTNEGWEVDRQLILKII